MKILFGCFVLWVLINYLRVRIVFISQLNKHPWSNDVNCIAINMYNNNNGSSLFLVGHCDGCGLHRSICHPWIVSFKSLFILIAKPHNLEATRVFVKECGCLSRYSGLASCHLELFWMVAKMGLAISSFSAGEFCLLQELVRALS